MGDPELQDSDEEVTRKVAILALWVRYLMFQHHNFIINCVTMEILPPNLYNQPAPIPPALAPPQPATQPITGQLRDEVG